MIEGRTQTDKAGHVLISPGEVQDGQTRTTVYNSVRCPAPSNEGTETHFSDGLFSAAPQPFLNALIAGVSISSAEHLSA